MMSVAVEDSRERVWGRRVCGQLLQLLVKKNAMMRASDVVWLRQFLEKLSKVHPGIHSCHLIPVSIKHLRGDCLWQEARVYATLVRL